MALEYKKIYDSKLSKQENKEINYNYIKEKIENSNVEYGSVSYANYAWVFETLKWKLISKVKLPRFIKKMMGHEND